MTSSLPLDAPRPRLCLIRKRTPEEEYGFNLHAEKNKGQFIGAVDAGSPADRAGLLPGDRIVSVNGASVINEPHKQVVSKIKENLLSCDLIVVDEESQDWYTERKIPIPTDPNFAEIRDQKSAEKDQYAEKMVASAIEFAANTSESPRQARQEFVVTTKTTTSSPRPPSYSEAVATESNSPLLRPRLCKLIKSDNGREFGFNLHAEKYGGAFIGKIDPNSIAECAGLEEGQRIVGVNGVLIYPHTAHKDVVSLIKANPLRSELLVASPEVDAWYKANAQEYDFDSAEIYTTVEESAIEKGVAQLTFSNGYATNGDSGFVNGDRSEDSMVKEVKSGNVEPQRTVDDYRSHSAAGYQEHSPVSFTRSQPPPPVEPYESIRDASPQQPHSPQQPDWMGLSAAQLRERVGQHKKPDPRTKQLSLQQKHEFIRNM